MAEITQTQWKAYITTLEKLNKTAAEEMRKFVVDIGGWNYHQQEVIDYAYALATKYGEGSASLSAMMYDATAEAQGANVPPATPAPTASLEEVIYYMYRVAAFSEITIPDGVARLVKQAGADTILQNAVRDSADFAWIPSGDTCPFCLTLAANGWRTASQKVLEGGHAKHIHANCNCEFAVRFDSFSGVSGYDPFMYRRIYDAAEGRTSKQKINSMRRDIYQLNKEEINAQKRAAYANRVNRNDNR